MLWSQSECSADGGLKAFAKGVIRRANVPTAVWKSFHRPGVLRAYVNHRRSVVVKADGLAAGKRAVCSGASLNRLSKVFASVSRVICQRAGAAVVEV